MEVNLCFVVILDNLVLHNVEAAFITVVMLLLFLHFLFLSFPFIFVIIFSLFELFFYMFYLLHSTSSLCVDAVGYCFIDFSIR